MKKVFFSLFLVAFLFLNAITVYADENNTQQVEITAEISPAYCVVIPLSQDFGELQRNTGIKTLDFNVEVTDVLIDDGAKVSVTVTGMGTNGAFIMKDKNGIGAVELPFSLYNNTNSPNPIEPGAVYGEFTANEVKNGKATVDTANITRAGSYKGTLTFTISYNID